MRPPKVLVVGMDGVRFDGLSRPGTAPVLQGLMARGAYGTSLLPYGVPGDADGVEDVAYTDSAPGWSTVATGVWPDKHRVMHNNAFTAADHARYPDFLTRAKTARPGLMTAAVLSWADLARHGTFGGPAGAGVDVCFRADGDREGYRDGDRAVAREAARCLTDQAADAVFVYFGATDEAAHEGGPHSAAYREALLAQDGHLGLLLESVRRRPDRAGERWTVVVTTDHGHLDEGGHGGVTDAEREVFVVLAELGADLGGERLDGPRLVDVAPTVLSRLGIPADPAWGLDGEPLRPARGA